MSEEGLTFIIDTTDFFITNQDKVPTFHFIEDTLGIKCSLRIDKPEYVNSYEDEKEIDNLEDMEFLVDFLKEKNSEFEMLTNYEVARRLWNLNYSGHNYPVSPMEMPDYKSLSRVKNG